MQLGGKSLEGLFQIFSSYVNMLIKALPGSMEEEANYEGSGNKIVRMAETESQQIALLANASLLADDLLPRAAMKLAPINQSNYNDDLRRRPADRQNRHPEQREWKRRLVSSVDRLKDSFCRQHALDLIFTEDGDSHLSADMYINMDGNADEMEWLPSPIFQVFTSPGCFVIMAFTGIFSSFGSYTMSYLHKFSVICTLDLIIECFMHFLHLHVSLACMCQYSYLLFLSVAVRRDSSLRSQHLPMVKVGSLFAGW